MKPFTVLGAVAGGAAAFFATPGLADGVGPPSGTIYAFDQAYHTVATPTSLPNRGPTDTIYVFPDCSSCASVSEAAPGYPGYNGGRWKVVGNRPHRIEFSAPTRPASRVLPPPRSQQRARDPGRPGGG